MLESANPAIIENNETIINNLYMKNSYDKMHLLPLLIKLNFPYSIGVNIFKFIPQPISNNLDEKINWFPLRIISLPDLFLIKSEM